METSESAQLKRPEVATELKAALAARRELGPELEDDVLAAFLGRLENHIDARVAERVGQQRERVKQSSRAEPVEVGVIAGSFALAIPLLAIAGGIAHTVGVIAVVFGLVAVNLLYFIDRWVRFSLD